MGVALPAQCCWILYPVLAPHPHELSLLRGRVSVKGKFSTFLPETQKETQKSFAKGQLVVVCTEGKQAAPILKGFTDGYFPPSLVYKIISLLGRFSNIASSLPGDGGRTQRKAKPLNSTRDPNGLRTQFLPNSQNVSLFPVLVD